MPEWLFETKRIRGRQLTPGDIPALNALFARCADYALLVNGEPPGANEADGIFQNRPPEVPADAQLTIGLYDADKLVGLIEALRDYPEPGTYYIGLMLLAPEHRGGGLGTEVHKVFERWVVKRGGERIMLSVVEENGAAYRFWQRVGYRETRRLPPARFRQKRHSRSELVLNLPHDAA